MRRLVTALALATIAVQFAAIPVAQADPSPGGPTASQVAASKAYVAKLERQVRGAVDKVTLSQARLNQLTTTAEIAIEAYDKSQVLLAAARRNLAAAGAVLDAASAQVATAKVKVGNFAAAAYRDGGLVGVDAVLTSNGPETMLYRISTLNIVSQAQNDALQSLAAAQVYQRVVRRQAESVASAAAAAGRAADRARAIAQSKVAQQTAAVGVLKQAQAHLASVLTLARQHASALERARLNALAEARAAAAAAAARAAAARQLANSHSGPSSVSIANTVSAATEQAAVGYAESQIGKPYQWGAAGPDSYDCSGLVMWSYAQVGVYVDHWTGFQWNEGAHIPLSALRPGDLVFFATNTSDPNTIHHVGMYIGNGQMVEAPYTGANVRISDAFRPDLIGAVRLYQH